MAVTVHDEEGEGVTHNGLHLQHTAGSKWVFWPLMSGFFSLHKIK